MSKVFTLPKEVDTDHRKIIMDAFHDRYGFYPIIHVDEYFNDHGIVEDFCFNVDTSLLHKIDTYEFRYIQYIFESIIRSIDYYGIEHKEFEYSTSLKYSFSDTDDWWSDIITDKDADIDICCSYVVEDSPF